MTWSRLALAAWLAAAAAGLAACAEEPRAAAQAPAPPSDPDQVVAEIGGRKVTLKDIDAKWEEFDAAERARVTQLLYQNRRNMLEQLIGDILIENAAKAAGQPVETFVTQDAAKRVKPVGDAEVSEFYEQNKDRTQGRTLDQLRAQIKDFLDAQRKLQARAQLVEELKAKHGTDVKVILDPPRYTLKVEDHDPIRGAASAPVTVVEFSDYQCPFCQRVNPTLSRVQQTYGNRVRIVFKDFPLPNHAEAFKASEAAHCAGEQGKYWEMHDVMFANQRSLQVPALKQAARALGIDGAKFDQCLDSGKHTANVRADYELGEKMGVSSTPTLYINGRPLIGAQPFEAFKQIIDEELARAGK